jgi:hypothetical protein
MLARPLAPMHRVGGSWGAGVGVVMTVLLQNDGINAE